MESMLAKLHFWKPGPEVDKKTVEFFRKYKDNLTDAERMMFLDKMEVKTYLWEIFENIKLLDNKLTRETWLKFLRIQLKSLLVEICREQSQNEQEAEVMNSILRHL